MSTQRRADRLARVQSKELAGAGSSTSVDVGKTDSRNHFRRVLNGLTASSSMIWIGMTGLATNSLSISSSCQWPNGHGSNELRFAKSSWYRWNGTTGYSPALNGIRAFIPAGLSAGADAGQLPTDSPLLARVLILHSALPQVPRSLISGTERQHGQGNLYFQHAARNAACDIGRRPTRRDLLRAGKRIHISGISL